MPPYAHFSFCPRCAVRLTQPTGQKFDCPSCGLLYFFNPVPSASVIIERANGDILLIKRGKEPAKGKLAPPGGIIDAGESAEEAAKREILEEVGLVLPEVEYLCSHPGVYPYAGIEYQVTDFFFTAKTTGEVGDVQVEEIDGYYWLAPGQVDPKDFAFDSVRAAWKTWLGRIAT